MIKITKGLNLPITGAPAQTINPGPKLTKVAILGEDYVGMKPTMAVKVGDKVAVGQTLFSDKKMESVKFTSPVSGTVLEINRGDKRVFQSVVVSVEGSEATAFSNYKAGNVDSLSEQSVKDLLLESGLWTAIRVRPFSKIANPETKPHSIFVTAIDTNPLAANPELVIAGETEAFVAGLKVLSKLTTGKVFLCTGKDSRVPGKDLPFVKAEQFVGPHPAGNVGTHIHYLDPVSASKFVWHVGYQDVISIGKLFTTGKLSLERVVSIAGPVAKNPRLVKTMVGASIEELTKDEVIAGAKARKISGSIFAGRTASGVFSYLGRFHNQVSLIAEGGEREFLGWHSPGFDKFSVKSIYLSKLIPGKKFSFNTSVNGSHRSMVPIGSYEKVMPGDFVPTFLLRSLLSNDTERAQALGCLELDEEDLALCTFVDPCKHEFGPILRQNLNTIEKDG